MEPFKRFDQLAQERAMKVAHEFLAQTPELQAISITFIWDIESQDLPHGIFLPRKDKFSLQTLFRFMDATSAALKFLFANLTRGKANEQHQDSRQQLPHPPLHHAELPQADGAAGGEVHGGGDGGSAGTPAQALDQRTA
jgi:hypothetical protein